MRSGLYAIASLDGAPIAAEDRAALGLAPRNPTDPLVAPGLVARVVDAEGIGGVTDQVSSGDEHLLFLGELDDPASLAAELGRVGAGPATIALLALRRWGDDAAHRLEGEWSLLHWNAQRRVLQIGVSRALRDVIHFATDGVRVAVSSELRWLGALPWVGSEIDPIGLAFNLGRAPVQERLAGRTVLRNICFVEAGTFRRFEAGRAPETLQRPADVAPRWEGSFEEAVSELEQELRLVVRRILARHGDIAILLSGGLDSALLAWLASEERRPGQTVTCLTGVVPPGSPHPDERDLARDVAQALGLPQVVVMPCTDARALEASANALDWMVGSMRSPRHYLYDALYDAARDCGASAVLDGCFGEHSITRRQLLIGPAKQLRRAVGMVRNTLRERSVSEGWPGDAYHARFSAALLGQLPADMAGRRPPAYAETLKSPDALLGFSKGYHKAARSPTTVAGGGLRAFYPFRHFRLIAMTAGMPVRFLSHGGMQRALAREMLKGRLPDHIRLQSKGLAFSPDYPDRLRDEASSLQPRIEELREAGAGEWVDLDWVAREAQRIAQGAILSPRELQKFQISVLAANFVVHWNQPRN